MNATAFENHQTNTAMDHCGDMAMMDQSKDEVDFVKVQENNNNSNFMNFKNEVTTTTVPKSQPQNSTNPAKVPKERLSLFSFSKKSSSTKSPSPTTPENEKNEKSNATTDNGFACQPPTIPIGTPPRHKKFSKSSSFSRLLGNTYNAKKFEKEEKKLVEGKFNTFGGRRRSSGPYLERFKRYAKEEGDVANGNHSSKNKEALASSKDSSSKKKEDKSKCDTLDRHLMALENFQEHRNGGDLSSKAMRTLSRGLGKLWWRRTHSIDISSPDPEFKVSYLGNVLTGWAKGEGCVEKQLNTLWRNYTQNNKPDVIMRLKVCASGLKATTRQHGLTEYWANRITHCCAPKNYPRVFCWIYRHEGRKLKHELRCHAVLCSKEKQVQEICDTLKANLECALREFKREKILKQNARLSLANAVYDNPSLPRRKILLSVGSNNYRPPLERSKSAPKLMAIEEAIGEEGEEAEETNEPEMKPCCQKDSLYPAMTLGRRRCRRGHSIRRTGKARPVSYATGDLASSCTGQQCCNAEIQTNKPNENKETEIKPIQEEECRLNAEGSDDSDDFEKILQHNNYDSKASLANELMPYFESQLHKKNSSSCGSLSDLRCGPEEEGEDNEPLSLTPTINVDPNADPINDFKLNNQAQYEATSSPGVSLRRSGVCSDGEDDFLGEEEEDMYFRQAAILNMLHRHSMRKMANLSLSSDEGSSSLETHSGARDSSSMRYKHQQQSSISSDTSTASSLGQQMAGNDLVGSKRLISNDSADEGSISSGCETASTVTNNQDDLSLQFRQSQLQQISSSLQHPYTADDLAEATSLESEIIADNNDLYKQLQGRSNSDAATTFSSSSSITLKMDSSPNNSIKDLVSVIETNPNSLKQTNSLTSTTSSNRPRRTRRQRDTKPDSDSECSDESGYVEYQERDKGNKTKQDAAQQPKPQLPTKPQIPPKPMPRRFISVTHCSSNSTSV